MMDEATVLVNLLIIMNHCTGFQFQYMENAQGEASSSYVSLVMLVIQVSGYMMPLISGLDDAESNNFFQAMFRYLIIPILLFLNITLFLIMICQVLASRTKLNSARSEIKVLIITLAIHAVGLSIFLNRSAGRLRILYILLKEIEAYWGLVVDFFLLPQIIANYLWQIKSKPLHKMYYIGFSLVRAVLRLQNYFKGTAYNATSDLAIAVTVLFLAFVVYIQQRQSVSSQQQPAAESHVQRKIGEVGGAKAVEGGF